MKRVVIRFKDKGLDHMNIEGDYIDLKDDFIYVYNGDYISAIVRHELINLICISEKKN
jgi:hypothetical protein